MGDVPDQLDRIVNDLFCVVDTLELRLFVQVHKILIEIEPCRREEGSCVVVQVSCDALAFFFLQAD